MQGVVAGLDRGHEWLVALEADTDAFCGKVIQVFNLFPGTAENKRKFCRFADLIQIAPGFYTNQENGIHAAFLVGLDPSQRVIEAWGAKGGGTPGGNGGLEKANVPGSRILIPAKNTINVLRVGKRR